MRRILVDPNVRDKDGYTYARIPTAPIEIQERVEVYEDEDGSLWDAVIVKYSAGFVWLNVDWDSWRD